MIAFDIAAEQIAFDAAVERAAQEAAAKVILPTLPAEVQEFVGHENMFGEIMTAVDVVGAEVRDAVALGQLGKFGPTANALFAWRKD